jgi:hypothetical protein
VADRLFRSAAAGLELELLEPDFMEELSEGDMEQYRCYPIHIIFNLKKLMVFLF